MKQITDIRLERKFDGDNVWFTSDTHFCHENIIRFCDRPFKNAEHMNSVLVDNWNSVVPSDGIVFHLGDFCHGGSAEWSRLLDRLNGRIVLILGNHDLKNMRQGFMDRFEAVSQQMSIVVDGQKIILNHNPFLCYGGSYKDEWQLFGHVHSGPRSHTGLDMPRLANLFPLQYDVGVDNNNYTPISFAGVKAKIERQIESASKELWNPNLSKGGNDGCIVFLDMRCCLGRGSEKGKILEGAVDNLRYIVESTGAFIVLTGELEDRGIENCTKMWSRQALPGSLLGVTPDNNTVKERIARWLSQIGRGYRYIYLGNEPFEDFRSLTIDPSVGITCEDAEKTISILGK